MGMPRPRYPRQGLLRSLREILRRWWLLVIWIAANDVGNIYNTLGSIHNFTDLIPQLVPFPIGQLWHIGPFLGVTASASALGLTGVGLLAHRDYTNEQVVLAASAHAKPISYGPPNEVGMLRPAEPFVGRLDDLEWTMRRLSGPRESRLAVLTGLGGIGKTALAAEVTRRLAADGQFKDGIAVLPCQRRHDTLTLLQDALAKFDPQRRRPQASDLAELVQAAQELLAGKDVLIVLDNVEPELPIAEVLQPLRSAGAAVLITARHQLLDALPAEAIRQLKPLSPEDALTVFVRSYGISDPLALQSEQRAAAVRIVHALAYHTLAVKLEGAYAASASRNLDDLAHELEAAPLKVHAENADLAVERAFQQSINKLPAGARRLFSTLAAFPTNEFSRNATIALARALKVSQGAQMLDLLIKRCLVEVPATSDNAQTAQIPRDVDRERLQIHPLLRAYAAQRLAGWPERHRMTAYLAVARYYADYVRRTPARWLYLDQINITGALDWAHSQEVYDLVVALCLGLVTYWEDRGLTSDALLRLPWGLAALRERLPRQRARQRPRDRAALLLAYGNQLQASGQSEEAVQVLHQALKSYRELKDHVGAGNALTALGQLALRRGQVDEAERQFREAIALHQGASDREGEANALRALVELVEQQGHLDEAEQYLWQALAIHQRLQLRADEGSDLGELGRIAKEAGRLIEAEALLRQALAVDREVLAQREEAGVLLALGQIAQTRGDSEGATTALQEALALHREVRYPQGEGVDLIELARVAKSRGHLDVAQRYAEQALAVQYQTQDRREQGSCLRMLGEIAEARGDLDSAQGYFEQALVINREVRYRRGEGIVLLALGRIAQARGQVDAAEAHLRAGVNMLRDVDRVSYATCALALGSLLITSHGSQEEGCHLLREAVAIRHELGLPDEQAARDQARTLGCKF
jgi:tetratricopeptide (TPR) repeat protein